MTVGAEQKEGGNPELKGWVKKNDNLFLPHAISIADSLDENSLSIVTGRYGVGKTYSLCPALKDELNQREMKVEFDDFANYLYKAPLFHVFKSQNKVVLLDEAGETLSTYFDDALRMTRRLYKSGIKVVSLFGYHPEITDLEEERINLWKEIALQATGKEPFVYKLPESILTPEVAREFLKDNYNGISQEVLDFILSNIPMNWKIINDLRSYSYSMEQLKIHVTESMQYWLTKGFMSKKEFENLERSIL